MEVPNPLLIRSRWMHGAPEGEEVALWWASRRESLPPPPPLAHTLAIAATIQGPKRAKTKALSPTTTIWAFHLLSEHQRIRPPAGWRRRGCMI